MRRFGIYMLASCFFCLPVLGQKAATEKKAPPKIEAINQAMEAFVGDGTISGAVTLVGHRGKTVHLGAVGLSDVEKAKEMKPATLFAIASMTKPIVATGVLLLQDEGKLNVDDQVAKYIPAFASMKLKDGTPANRKITIRDCITHTSGLVGKQIFAEPTLEAGVNELAKRKLAFQPGSKWQYSPGLNVAGRVIEIVSKQPLEKFLQERLFDPLQMKQTTFFPDKKMVRRVATLYGLDGDKKLKEEEGFLGNLAEIKAPNPSGGLISSARDMHRFYQMILRGGKFRKKQIVSNAAVQMMTSRQTGDLKTGFTPGNCWGLGWCIVQEPQEVTGMLSKGTFGHGGAFGTQGWVDPKTKTVYVLMIQRKGLLNSDGSDIRKNFQQAASDALK